MKAFKKSISLILIFTILFSFPVLSFGTSDENTQVIKTNGDMLQCIIKDLTLLYQLIFFQRQRMENPQNNVSLNTDSLRQNVMVLQMLTREIKALNVLVFMKQELNELIVEENKIYTLLFTADNITGSKTISYKVEYDKEVLELIDPCGITEEIETETGLVTGTDIEITEINTADGIIRFIANKTIPATLVWSGVLNAIRFKGIQTATTKIKIIKN